MALLDSSGIRHKDGKAECITLVVASLVNSFFFLLSGLAGLGLAASLHCFQQLDLQQPAQSGVTAQDQVSVLGEHRLCGLGHVTDASWTNGGVSWPYEPARTNKTTCILSHYSSRKINQGGRMAVS